MKRAFDVCVFGVGPAGASVAARLADGGVEVVVLDRPSKEKSWGGESFTGSIRQPLATLGLWDGFLAAGHVRGFEQRTGWGGAARAESSIFRHYGNFWHVDRNRFDGDLREAVRQRGISILTYRTLNEVRQEGGEWHLAVDEAIELTAKYLVDATGRACALARKLGLRTRRYDRLVALTVSLPRNKNPEFDHAMVVETTPAGWWYAAPVPRGHILSFFTDADLVPRELKYSMRTVAANSAFTQPEGEHGWLTVGDACAAHDPLCGWGVYRAMNNGILAADAICQYLGCDDASLLKEYRRHCLNQFESYLKGLAKHYSYETRWAGSTFWKRRSQSVTALNSLN